MKELVRRLREMAEYQIDGSSIAQEDVRQAADTITLLMAALEGLVQAVEPSLARDCERPCRVCNHPDHSAMVHGDRTRRLAHDALDSARAALREVGR